MSRTWRGADTWRGPSRTPRRESSLANSSTTPHGTGSRSEWPTNSSRVPKRARAAAKARATSTARRGPTRVGSAVWSSTVTPTQPSISPVGRPTSLPQRLCWFVRALRYSRLPDPNGICTAKHAARADRHPHNHHGNVMRALGRNQVRRTKLLGELGR